MKEIKPQIWQVTIPLPVIAVEVFMEAFEDFSSAVSCFENDSAKEWILLFYTQEQPPEEEIQAKVELLAGSIDIPSPDYKIAEVENADWVAESQKNFHPVEAGKFFIHPTWYEGEFPEGLETISIDPEQAFGTGGHETTSSCLALLSKLADDHIFKNMLDMGCGSGVLAIAMAKLWQKGRVLAVDIDPISVETTIRNAKHNDVALHISAEQSDGYNSHLIKSSGPFDLIASNILAEPLIEFAPMAKKSLAKGGYLVLSGLLDTQKNDVIKAYTKQKLEVVDTITIKEWTSLVLKS